MNQAQIDEALCLAIDADKREIERLERELAEAKVNAEYAWKNTQVIEKARQDEMAKRDALAAQVVQMREALEFMSARDTTSTPCRRIMLWPLRKRADELKEEK